MTGIPDPFQIPDEAVRRQRLRTDRVRRTPSPETRAPNEDGANSSSEGDAPSPSESRTPHGDVPRRRSSAPATRPSAEPAADISHLKPAEHTPVPVTDTREGYLEAVAKFAAGTGPLAVDAERASGFRYSQRAYLIQIYREGAGTVLFDPPAIGDFSELQAAIGGEEWVLHAASQDLPCLREVGLDPERIFDTELAARLLGIPRVGLGAVVAEELGIHLEKAFSAADWSTRPLPEEWLTYAALDVELLVELRDKLAAKLEEQDKVEIARQEFQAVLDKEQKPPAVDPWRKLSGIHTVRSARNLAVAKELWLARDEYAREVDTSPGRLLPDRSIVAVVQNLPANRRALLSMKDFSGRASRSQGDRWWAAIQRGLAVTQLPSVRGAAEGLPQARLWPERNPAADLRLKAAKPAVAAIGEKLDIPVENLLTPETLRRVAWEPPQPITTEGVAEALAGLGARPWQIDTTAETIATAFVDAAQKPPQDAPAPS